MRRFLRSFLTAALVAVAIQCVTIGIIAANLPRVVGPPVVRLDRTLRLPIAGKLRISNRDGYIRLRTGETEEVLLETSVKAYARMGSDEAAVRRYAESTVNVSTGNDVLNIVTEIGQRPDTLDLQADYTVLVPTGTDIDIDGANGNVWVSKGCGSVEIRGRNTDPGRPDGPGPHPEHGRVGGRARGCRRAGEAAGTGFRPGGPYIRRRHNLRRRVAARDRAA